MGGSSSGTLTNTFVGGNYAEYGTGGIYVSGGALSLIFSTVYDDSVADVTYPSSLYVLGYGSLTAIGSIVGSSSNLPVIELAPQATIDDTYLVVAGPPVSLVGPGSRSVPAGTLQLGNLDNTSTPGQGGRSPASTSVLVTGAATSDLDTGVTKDQLNVDRGTVADPTWTIGARQVAAGAGPTPGPTPPSPVAPSAPRDVTVVPGNASAVVSWVPPASAGAFPVTTYRVVASPGGRACLASAPALSCVVTGLTNGATYTFTVAALSGAGWSTPSAPSAPVTPSAGPVPAPDPVPVPPLDPGESFLTVDGVPAPVGVNPNGEDNGVDIAGDDFAMDLQGLDGQGRPLDLGPDGVLVLNADRQVETSGTGFLGASEIDLYLDPPTLVTTGTARMAADQGIYVGTVVTNRQGSFSGTALLPEGISVGDHVVQAVGRTKSGGTRAVSLGVRVDDPITVPGPVRDIEVVRVTSEGTVVLRWRTPAFDGGSPVTSYRVGQRRVSEKAYTPVRPNPTMTRVRITGLTPGRAYWVRIKAGNIAGFGPGTRYAERVRIPLA